MITAPGAPLTGLALPASTDPSPSPSHQTASDQATDAPSAIFTVGRRAIPSASRSCTVAKTEFAATACCPMMCADHLIGAATTAGLPSADAASMRPAVKLEHAAADVHLHGARAEKQLAADLTAGIARCHQPHDLGPARDVDRPPGQQRPQPDGRGQAVSHGREVVSAQRGEKALAD